MKGCKQSTNVAGITLLQGGTSELPKMVVAQLRRQSVRTIQRYLRVGWGESRSYQEEIMVSGFTMAVANIQRTEHQQG